MRYIALAAAVLVVSASVPALAQQGGPVGAVGEEGTTSTASQESFFPLWKSLREGKQFLPPYGINLVLFDLSGQWDVKNFSASVSGNQLVSIAGKADVHPFTYGLLGDGWVLPFF